MTSCFEQLLPRPQRSEITAGAFTFPVGGQIQIHLENAVQETAPLARRLQQALKHHGIRATLTAVRAPVGTPAIRLRLDPDEAVYIQGYRLNITPEGITLIGADLPGFYYGLLTLSQLLELSAEEGTPLTLPAGRIVDWPDFPHRGVMLDVSRDKVPQMETLYALVELLASWKVNQVQLYMEHTFAYPGHEEVWGEASPFTGDEMLALDTFCREHFIELVPNQNSFGHMHRWLKHERYRFLAECPGGAELWPGYSGEPFSLCPTDPAALALLAELYDQLLPHFSSTQFNVGLDETFDLGHCRSAELCAEVGTERVYLDFLQKVHELVNARGYTMQFWGDIILHRPDLIPELPEDAIALEWGYEATHPFAEHVQHFAEAGLHFYVCPGTSSWNSIAGRTANALGNIQSAAEHGKAAGASGLLNTDWGDNGHMQPLPVSYLGFLVGAALSWNTATDLEALDVPALLDRYAFRDEAGVMGRLAYDLGNVYRTPGYCPGNNSLLFLLLLHPDRSIAELPHEGDELPISQDSFQASMEEIDRIMAPLDEARMQRPDAELIKREFRWAADVLRWAAQLGAARMAHEGAPASELPAEVREELAAALRPLLARHRELWLQRHRPGGLADSVARLERTLATLE